MTERTWCKQNDSASSRIRLSAQCRRLVASFLPYLFVMVLFSSSGSRHEKMQASRRRGDAVQQGAQRLAAKESKRPRRRRRLRQEKEESPNRHFLRDPSGNGYGARTQGRAARPARRAPARTLRRNRRGRARGHSLSISADLSSSTSRPRGRAATSEQAKKWHRPSFHRDRAVGASALRTRRGNDSASNAHQLLVEMDGFNTNEGLIVMAATNRATSSTRLCFPPLRRQSKSASRSSAAGRSKNIREGQALATT
jgi:hypothetical protein